MKWRWIITNWIVAGLLGQGAGCAQGGGDHLPRSEDLTPDFSVEIVNAVSVDTTRLDPLSLNPAEKTYIVKACLRDSQNQAIVGQFFSVDPRPTGMQDRPSDAQGCIYWPEAVSFDWLAAERDFATPPRRLIAQGEHQGMQTVSLRVDPWKKGVEGLRDTLLAPLARDPGAAKDEPPLLFPAHLNSVSLTRSFAADAYLNLALHRSYQFTLALNACFKNRLDEGSVVEPIRAGRFRLRAFIYSVDGAAVKSGSDAVSPTLFSSFDEVASVSNGILQANITFDFDFSESLYFASNSRLVLEISPLENAKRQYAPTWVAAPFSILDSKASFDLSPDSLSDEDKKFMARFEGGENFQKKLPLTASPYEIFRQASGFAELGTLDLTINKADPIPPQYALVPADKNELIQRPSGEAATRVLKNLCFQFNAGEAAHECRRNVREWIQVNNIRFVENFLGEPQFFTYPSQLSLQAYLKDETEISNHELDGTRDMREYFATAGALAFFEGVIPLEGIGVRFAHDSFHLQQIEHASLLKAGHQSVFQRLLNVEATQMDVLAKTRACAAIVPLKGAALGKHLLLCRFRGGRTDFDEGVIHETWYFISDADAGDHSPLRDGSQIANRSWSMALRGRVPFRAFEAQISDRSKDLLMERSPGIQAVRETSLGLPENALPHASRSIKISEILLQQGALPGAILDSGD